MHSLRINKRVIVDRYNTYGEGFETHVRRLGGTYDEIVRQYLEPRIVERTRLLDVAGGDGLSTSLLDPVKVSIVSTDISGGLLDVARRRRPNHVVGILHDFDDPFPFLDETFDCVVCISALEFCADLDATVGEMLRVAKIGGLVLFTTDRLDPNSAVQRDEIFVHDERGFFSRRYPTDHVIDVAQQKGGELLQQNVHNAYRLNEAWVRYDYFLVRKI